jgi:hypothetical protein
MTDRAGAGRTRAALTRVGGCAAGKGGADAELIADDTAEIWDLLATSPKAKVPSSDRQRVGRVLGASWMLAGAGDLSCHWPWAHGGRGGAGRCSEEDAAARPGKKRLRGVGAGLPMERRETRMREDGRDSDGREDTRTA